MGLLVLSRRPGERVAVDHAGERLWVAVVLDERGRLRLSFDGPRSFDVSREEILPGPDAEPVGHLWKSGR